MPDPKVIASTVAAGLGATIALIRSVSEFVGEQSPAIKMKEESQRAQEMMDLVAKLQTQQTEESAAACEQIKCGLAVTLKRLGKLAADASKVTRDPNSDLTFVQRLFIMFRPVGAREYTIHALVYMAAAGGALLFLFRDQLQPKFPHGFADLIVLVCYGLIVFRSWALAERRWRHGHEPAPDVFRNVFAVRKPLNWQMRTAQISMWFCLFWLVEGAEDVIMDVIAGNLKIAGLLGPGTALSATVMCRLWSGAEFKFAAERQESRPRRMILSKQKDQRLLIRGIRGVLHVMVVPLPLLLKTMTVPEPIDVAGFLCTAVLCIAAWNRWLVLQSRMRVTAKHQVTPAGARAAAA